MFFENRRVNILNNKLTNIFVVSQNFGLIKVKQKIRGNKYPQTSLKEHNWNEQ